MKIYKFPILDSSWVWGDLPKHQPIDLDYIVSVGPVGIREYTGSSIGESFCYFPVYIKIGNAFDVVYNSGTTQRCPTALIEKMLQEREKLIQAWGATSEKT